MSTAKRQRKKAGRQARLAQIEAARKQTVRRRQGIIAAVIVVIAVGLVYTFSRGGSTHKTKAAVAVTCPAPNGTSARRTSFPGPPPTCISSAAHYTAAFTTDVGSFTVSLDAQAAPVTVNDFVFLARYHFYNGLVFQRVIPGFVVQGGDLAGTGAGPPPYTVKGEVPKAGAYKIGSLAMAKTSSQPSGTSGSQFFIIVGQQGVSLPPQYSLFGQVTSGMAVVNKIAADGTASGTPKVTHKMLSVAITQS